MTFLWLQVRIQGDGNSQEDIKAEGPSVIIRDSGISEDVDPAAMPWNSCSDNPPGSSVLGILQARIQEWVAITFSRRFT